VQRRNNELPCAPIHNSQRFTERKPANHSPCNLQPRPVGSGTFRLDTKRDLLKKAPWQPFSLSGGGLCKTTSRGLRNTQRQDEMSFWGWASCSMVLSRCYASRWDLTVRRFRLLTRTRYAAAIEGGKPG
jgi:hypothetical protein